MVRHIRLEAVRHRVRHGPPADPDRISVRPALRRVRADYDILKCTIFLWLADFQNLYNNYRLTNL